MCVTKFSINVFETMYTHAHELTYEPFSVSKQFFTYEIMSENIGLTHTKDYNAYSL